METNLELTWPRFNNIGTDIRWIGYCCNVATVEATFFLLLLLWFCSRNAEFDIVNDKRERVSAVNAKHALRVICLFIYVEMIMLCTAR